MTRIVVACACVVVGLGAIVGVAATAGPPDGYEVFHDRGVRVDLPTGFRAVGGGGPTTVVAVAGPDRDGVQVTAVPTGGRSLHDQEIRTLQRARAAAPDAQDVARDDVDVPGADEARRITFHDPGRDRDVTIVIARDGDRFVTLSIDRAAHSAALDEQTVEDSFAISG